jgi:hypothetical protein
MYACCPGNTYWFNIDQRQNDLCQKKEFTYKHKDYKFFQATEQVQDGALLTIYANTDCTGKFQTFLFPAETCIFAGVFHLKGNCQEFI